MILTLGITIALAVRLRGCDPLVTFGVGWFLLFLVPSAALILLATMAHPMAEHRVYLASCGFFMLWAVPVARLTARRESSRRAFRATVAVLVVVIGMLAALTVTRMRVWSDPVRLWEDAARKAPETYMAHYLLGLAHRDAGDCESAVDPFRRAIGLRPAHPDGYASLAQCLAEAGQPESARQVLLEGIARVAPEPRLRLMLARYEEQVFRRPASALRWCREALSIAPEVQEARECVARHERR
jgi:tetratricopeptide (TPR) repeat protein